MIASRPAAVWLWTVLAVACASEEPARFEVRPPVADPFKPRPKPPPTTDAAGNLLPGDEKVAWLAIPRGFSRRDFDTHHVFTAQNVPLDRIEAFISARVMAKHFERTARSAAFKHAGAVSGPSDVYLDIVISPGARPGEVLLSVDEFPDSKAPPLPFDQARDALAHDQKTAE